jgi:kynureninase
MTTKVEETSVVDAMAGRGLAGPAGIEQALAAMGGGPLCEQDIQRHIAPLFSRVLKSKRIYLANHSLGRPLDLMAEDVQEGMALWYGALGDAWEPWMAEREAFRARVAELIHAPRPDCIVPKTAAGQGLRAVLNALAGRPRVVTTRGEFDAVDVILKQYAAVGRIEVSWIEPDWIEPDPMERRRECGFTVEPLIEAVERGADLVVVSQVMFMTGQIVGGASPGEASQAALARLAAACHQAGARLLVDAYHAVGIVPVEVTEMGADFLIGGSYKYLRGGPGAGFLYIAPRVLDEGFRPLDTGWFAKEDFFAFERADGNENGPLLKRGGDAFLEGTPPVLTWYQARSGQQFTLAMGVDRLRAYSQRQARALRGYLADAGVTDVAGGDSAHGGFVAVRCTEAKAVAQGLEARGIVADARGERVRICPDCLTRDEELRQAAAAVGELLRSFQMLGRVP